MKIAKKSKSKRKAKPSEHAADALGLQGYIIWMNVGGDNEGAAQRFEIQTAILREGGNEIAIDCNCSTPGEPPYVYTILLRRESPLLFRGGWTAGESTDRSTGTCTCRVYSNGPLLALVGTWHEDGIPQQWLAELRPAHE